MRLRSIAAMLWLLPALAGRADLPAVSFERYQPILDRQPFGSAIAVAADTNAASVTAAQEALIQQYRPCSIVEVDGGGLRVGLVDLKNNNKSLFLIVGEEGEDGLKIVSADYNAEEAVLQKGGQTATLKIKAGPALPAAGRHGGPPAGPGAMPPNAPPPPAAIPEAPPGDHHHSSRPEFFRGAAGAGNGPGR